MPASQIQINNIGKAFSKSLITTGISIARSSYSNLIFTNKPYGAPTEAIHYIMNIPVTERDVQYYFATAGDIQEMCAWIWYIVQNFKWQTDIRDCDDRAKLVSALFSLIFGLNTCSEAFCEVTDLKTSEKTMHWNNLIVDNQNNVILFDVDNSGLTMTLQPNTTISMGKWSYKFQSCRF